MTPQPELVLSHAFILYAGILISIPVISEIWVSIGWITSGRLRTVCPWAPSIRAIHILKII